MSLVAKEITALLTSAVAKHDSDALAKAFDLIKLHLEDFAVLGPATHKHCISPDVYLFAAETALNFPDQWDVVRHCVYRLQEDGTAMTAAYRVRGLFVRAALERRDAEGLRGPELITAVSSALAYVVRGIRIALLDTQGLSHLAFMGVQHLWNMGSILYQDGTFAELIPVITFAVSVLDKIESADARYKAIWLFRQATAFAGAGRGQDAWAAATKANDLVMKCVPQLKFWSYRMQVGLCRVAPNPKVKADAKGTLRGIYAAHSLFTGILDEAASEVEVMGAINEVAAEIKAAAEREALEEKNTSPLAGGKPGAKAASPPPSGKKGEPAPPQSGVDESAARDEVYAELGLAAALVNQLKVASEIANKAALSKRLTARVYSDYAKAYIQAAQCGGLSLQEQTDFNFCAPEVAHELLGAARRLERAIDSALRIVDPADRHFVVQQGALLMWNISLPLLQPATRALLSKSLLSTVKALDAINSNLCLLRTQLHLEVATVDADAQFVSKALARTELALQIDYAPPADHAKLYALPRPLDRYLVWMKRWLCVKGQLYTKPDGAEDEALLILEQAADANPGSRSSLLNRAAAILAESEPPVDYYVDVAQDSAPPAAAGGKAQAKGAAAPAPAPGKAMGAKGAAPKAAEEGEAQPKISSVEIEQRRLHLRTRSQLWAKLLSLSWESKSAASIGLARQAGEALVARAWPRRGDRDMNVLRANAYLTLAETYVLELAKTAAGAHLGQFTFLVDADADGESAESDVKLAAQQARAVAAAQTSVQDLLVKSCLVGAELVNQGWPDQWIVCNAAITLWNYFAAAFAKNNFTCAGSALEAIYPLLVALNLKPKKETALLADMTVVYARSLIQAYVKEKMNLKDTPQDYQTLSEQDLSTFGTVDAAHLKLAKAVEACEKMIAQLPTSMDAMKLCMLSAAARRLQGRPPEPRTDAQLKVITAIEQCGQAIPIEEKRTVLASVHTALALDPNMELCARLAEKCLHVPGAEKIAIRVCSIGQALYADGKLGVRHVETASTAAPGAAAAAAAAGKQAAAKSGAKSTPAAVADDTAKDTPAELPVPSEDDWTWFALMLQYQALAVVSLVDPAVQDKHTQLEIRKQALVALTNSAVAATRAAAERRPSLVIKNVRLYAAISQEFAGHAGGRSQIAASLKILLGDNVLAFIGTLSGPKRSNNGGAKTDADAAGASRSSRDADAVAQLFVMLINALRDQSMVEAGMSAMKTALRILPASHHKPLWDLDVELRCQAGLPLNQTLLRVKEYDAETQARVWMSLARHSPDRKNQLFAYQNAIAVLEGKATEKAAHLLGLAQWMAATNYNASLDDVRTVVLSAVDLLSNVTDAEDAASQGAGHDDASEGGDRSRLTHRSGDTGGASPATQRSASDMSATHRSESGGPSMRSQKLHAAATAPPTARSLVVMIQAYYVLAAIGSESEAAATLVDGTPTDKKSALALAAHYVSRLWAHLSHAAAEHSSKQRQRLRKLENRQAALQSATASPSGAGGKGAAANQKLGRGMSMSVALPPTATGNAGAAATSGESAALPWSVEDDAFVLPSDPVAWATYHPTPAFIRALHDMADGGAVAALSADTVRSPGSFLDVLAELSAMLYDCGFGLEALPVIAMRALGVQLLVRQQAVSAAALLAAESEAYEVCSSLGVDGAAIAHRIAGVGIDPADRASLWEDVKMEAARSGTSGPRDGAVTAATTSTAAEVHVDPQVTITSRSSMVKPARKHAAPSFGAQLPTSAVQLFDAVPNVYPHWIRIAEGVINAGRPASATLLLEEALRHASKCEDTAAVAHIAYLNSRLLLLQGHIGPALAAIRHTCSLLETFTPSVKKLTQYRLQEVVVVAADGDFDAVFAIYTQLQDVIVNQAAQKSGMHKALASLSVPRALGDLGLRFSRIVIDAFKTRQDTSGAPPTQVLEKLRDIILRAGEKIASCTRASLPTTPGQASNNSLSTSMRRGDAENNTTNGLLPPPTATDVCFPVDAQLLLIDVERLLATPAGFSSLTESKRSLALAGTRLSTALKALQDATLKGGEAAAAPLEVIGAAPRCPSHRRLGEVSLKLAENIVDTVQLRIAIMAEHRRGTSTLVTFPRVTAASAAPGNLETKLVEFMRSSKKQRQAATRREVRAAQRLDVEERRAKMRQQKQAQVEARREQRRQEEAAAVAAGTVNPKKDAKATAPAAASGGKGGKNQPPAIQEDPDIDPEDKCDIPSPPPSDDDGEGEDDFSEDEQEVSLAIRSTTAVVPASSTVNAALPWDDAWVAAASLPLAQTLAIRAEEVFGSTTALGARAKLVVARATRMLADAIALSHERRAAILSGSTTFADLQLQTESTAVLQRWTAAADPEEAEHVAAAAAPSNAKGGKAPAPAAGAKTVPAADGKKPPTGKQTAAQLASTGSAAATADGRRSVEHAIVFPQPNHANLALLNCAAAVGDALRRDDMALLPHAFLELAHVGIAVGSSTATVAGCIAAAQASCMRQYLTNLWLTAAPSDASEAVILRTVTTLAENPATANTPAHLAAIKALHAHSKMTSRLRIPESALTLLLPPEEVARCLGGTSAAAVGAIPPLPNDFTVLTICATDSAQKLYLALHRGNKNVTDIRRVTIPHSTVAQLNAAALRTSAARRANLSANYHQPRHDHHHAQHHEHVVDLHDPIDVEFASLCRATSETIVKPLLGDLVAALEGTTAKTHLVLCLDPSLQGLPFEAAIGIEKFKSVSRDLSYFAVCQRAARRVVEKFTSGSLTLVVDPLAEAPASVSALLGGEEKPKLPQWTLLGATTDDKNTVRPFSTTSIQRALVSPPAGAGIVLSACGSVSNTIPLDSLVGVDLGHLRLLVALCGSVTPASTRRENQTNMTKSAALKFAELPFNVPLMMLARGIDCVVANLQPVSVATHEAVGRMCVASLEKVSQLRHLGEVVRSGLHRTLPTTAGDGASEYKLVKATSAASPPDGDVFKTWNLPAMERFGYVVFGVSPDDATAAGAGAAAAAGKKGTAA